MYLKYGHMILMMLSSLIGIALFATFPLYAVAAEKTLPILFSHLNSPSENSALSGSCNGDTSSAEIDCYFVQTRIRLKADPKKLPEKLKELQAEMENEKKDSKALSPQVLSESFCADLADKSKKDQLNQKLKEVEHTAPQTYAGIREMLSLCNNPSYDKFMSFLKKDEEAKTRTCLISSDTDFKTLHLKKIGTNKWIGTAGPSGLCNVVTTWTLEHEPNSNLLWTYTQIRSHADQTNELCKGIEVGEPLIYSWKNKPIEMKCDFIEFGW